MAEEHKDAVQQEREMEAHEREAAEREAQERDPQGDAETDAQAPPGSTGRMSGLGS